MVYTDGLTRIQSHVQPLLNGFVYGLDKWASMKRQTLLDWLHEFVRDKTLVSYSVEISLDYELRQGGDYWTLLVHWRKQPSLAMSETAIDASRLEMAMEDKKPMFVMALNAAEAIPRGRAWARGDDFRPRLAGDGDDVLGVTCETIPKGANMVLDVTTGRTWILYSEDLRS